MSQALALLTLTVVASGTADAGIREGAVTMAHTLDKVLLAPMANAAAFTGFVLSAATAWGYWRHWWVLAKFGLTVAQLWFGIWVLSSALGAAEEAAKAGLPLPDPTLQIAGAGTMATALAFQAWLSVAKPGGKTPWAPPRKPPVAPTWVFVAGTVVPFADFALSLTQGGPRPLFSLIALAVILSLRPQRLRSAAPAKAAA
jgi:hypothetical protein